MESVGYKKRLDAPLSHWALAAVADGNMITTIASVAATVPMILRTGSSKWPWVSGQRYSQGTAAPV
jgi:hypothetical protein